MTLHVSHRRSDDARMAAAGVQQHWLDAVVSRIAIAAHRAGDVAKARRATDLLRRIRIRHELKVQ